MHGGGPGGPGFPGGPGIPGGHGEFEIFAEGPGIDIHVALPMEPGARADVVANTIGIDLADLLTQLADGSTVAEIATANGVDPQAVIDAVVQDVNERLTAAVESGRLTQEEADERLANMTERITNWVNGTASSEAATEEPATDTAANRSDHRDHDLGLISRHDHTPTRTDGTRHDRRVTSGPIGRVAALATPA